MIGLLYFKTNLKNNHGEARNTPYEYLNFAHLGYPLKKLPSSIFRPPNKTHSIFLSIYLSF